MKRLFSSKNSSYFIAAFIMFLGFVYNFINQDLFGSGIFFVSAVVFLFIAITKKRSLSKLKSTE